MPPGQFGLMQNTPVIYLWPHGHGVQKNFLNKLFFFPSTTPAFTRSCANSVTDCSTVNTLCRSKTCTVPRIEVFRTKRGSVQVFVRSKIFPDQCKRDLRIVWSGGPVEAGLELRKVLNSTTYTRKSPESSAEIHGTIDLVKACRWFFVEVIYKISFMIVRFSLVEPFCQATSELILQV